MIDTETGYNHEPEAPEPDHEAPYWMRSTQPDKALQLFRVDGSIFADVRKALDGDFSAWLFYANDSIIPAYFKSELAAIRACDAALAMESAR